VSVDNFDPTPMLETIEAALKERGGLDRKSRQSSAPAHSQEIGAPSAPGGGPVEDLLAAPRPGQDARLRRIDVSVTWTEGDHEEHVTRTTFAFDRTGLDALFPKKEVAPSNDGSAGKRKKPGTGQTGSSRSGSQRGASGGSGSPGFNSQPRDFGTPMRQRRRDIRDAIKAGGS
jgi:hypothetical protein